MADPVILAEAIDDYADALERHRAVIGRGFGDVDKAFVHLMQVWQGEGAAEFGRRWEAATGGFEPLCAALPTLLKELRSRAVVLRGI
ncbi:hypothetical protein [Arachnia propionica]|uniref:WXG100 family type VII secretion target n=1 Tax=Arachnia propionica TaxID=1750 RepID=A0A3P1WSC9_9ACTN|nr:hypothetical protein [Arachnia propionica]RRD48768.1 hypothetical protein EII35_11210 [Arachnia propionica]